MSAIRSLDAGYQLTEEARLAAMKQAEWLGECVQHTARLYNGFEQAGEWYVLVREPDGKVEFLPPRLELCNHSPTGFSWGYGGSGAAQLALALCCHATGNDRMASKVYQRFKFRWVSIWEEDRDWQVSQEWVQREVLSIAAVLKIDESDELNQEGGEKE